MTKMHFPRMVYMGMGIVAVARNEAELAAFARNTWFTVIVSPILAVLAVSAFVYFTAPAGLSWMPA